MVASSRAAWPTSTSIMSLPRASPTRRNRRSWMPSRSPTGNADPRMRRARMRAASPMGYAIASSSSRAGKHCRAGPCLHDEHDLMSLDGLRQARGSRVTIRRPTKTPTPQGDTALNYATVAAGVAVLLQEIEADRAERLFGRETTIRGLAFFEAAQDV